MLFEWRELKRQIAVLKANNEDQEDYITGLRQNVNSLKRQCDSMQEKRGENGLNQLSLIVAGLVEDQFAMSHAGGRAQRQAKIQVIIREAMRDMLTGERQCNAWYPGSCLPPPTPY